jgi:trans-L-3-hydroxyproline dehydratase
MNLDWSRWQPPNDALVITTIDAHAAGEPLRIVTGGLPELQGDTMLERRRTMQQHFDHVRQALMWEPRGHFNMYGCVLTPPVTPDAQFGVLFMHNEGYSTMCGHGIIALVTALIETGAMPATGAQTPVNLDTPAGLVRATAHLAEHGHVARVSFLNVPSFLYARQIRIPVSEFGSVVVDIAFGGAFYAFVPVASLSQDLRVVPEQTAQLVAAGEAIKRAVNRAIHIEHPYEKDLGFLYGTILTDTPADPTHHSRNVCIFAHAEVDRSPTGTGVSARLALHHAKGELSDDATIMVESILGKDSVFHGRIAGHTQVGAYPAIVPEVSGVAHITGRHEFIISPRDALGKGFLVEGV